MNVLAASEATRPVFWNFVPALELLWYVLAIASVAVFAYGFARPILKYQHGRGGALPPLRSLPRAIRVGGGEMLRHRALNRRDKTAGWAHQGIFYGFVVLFIGTVILGFQTDFTEPVFGWSYFDGNFYLATRPSSTCSGRR